MPGIVDMHLEAIREFEKFRKNYTEYVKVIKKLADEHFGNLYGVFVFGSVLKKTSRPLSDIDVAVVLFTPAEEEERIGFYRKIREVFGFSHPFEIHIVSKGEWDSWYRRFIKDCMRVY